jgi:hypothetical protein
MFLSSRMFLPQPLGPVEIHLELMTAAHRWIIAVKLATVLHARMAMRLNFLSFRTWFSIISRHLQTSRSLAGDGRAGA